MTGINGHTLKTSILQMFLTLLFSGSGQHSPHHSLSQCWGHCNLCTAACHGACDRDKSAGRSCSWSELWHLLCSLSPGMLEKTHSPGNVSSALTTFPQSCRRCRLCSWHFSPISDGLLEPPRGSCHGQGPTEATIGELLGGLQHLCCSSCAAPVLGSHLGGVTGGQTMGVTTEMLRGVNRADSPIPKPFPAL